MISRENQQAIILTVIGIIAVWTIFSCSNVREGAGNREMIDWIHNEPIKGTGTENAGGGGEGRSQYLSGKEQFSHWRTTNKGVRPVGVLYMGFRNEIKIQLFSEYLSVTFKEGDFAFRVYKNCTVEFVI